MSATAVRVRARLKPTVVATLLVALVVLQGAAIVALGTRLFGVATLASLAGSPVALALLAVVTVGGVVLFALGRASASLRDGAHGASPLQAGATDTADETSAPVAGTTSSIARESAGMASVADRDATPWAPAAVATVGFGTQATGRSTAGALQQAADAGELRLFLQPRISLADTGVVGAEALVRWQHPQHGLMLPGEFLEGVDPAWPSRPLTLWVLEEAARRWETLRHDGVPLRLSLNLSAHDLFDPELPAQLRDVLARHQAPAQAFCLEVADAVVAADPARAAAALHALAGHGFRLAVDGFGAGASSVGQLAGLPVHEIKLDRSLVQDLDRDPAHARTVR